MALSQCDKCSEMVDEAKAFCPGCGSSFVIESKREITSNFDSFEGTIKLGDTMFNQMLSDMGLNISKAPDAPEKPPEVISLEPAAAKPPEPLPPPPAAAKPASNTKWYILGGVAFALVILVIVAAVIAIFMFWPR
jgi:hypothetical protein